MAPSSTRMRSAAALVSAARTSAPSAGWNSNFTDIALGLSGGRLRRLRAEAEKVADGVGEIGAVQRVKVEFRHAAIEQFEHLLGGNGGGDQPTGCRIAVEALEAPRQPIRHACPALLGKAARLVEVEHRHQTRHHRDVDAARPNSVEEAEIDVVLEEELRDRPCRARVDLALENVEIGLEVRAFRMLFRKGRDRDLEVADAPEPAHEIARVGG